MVYIFKKKQDVADSEKTLTNPVLDAEECELNNQIIEGTLPNQHIFFCFVLFLRQSFPLVTQAGVQWRDLGSPQPQPPGLGNSPASAS